MPYAPISKLPTQYLDSNGDPYSGAVLKAYEAGTSTPLSLATDNTGATTAASIALNSAGYPAVSGNVVIPHANQNYKLSLYPDQTAADANSGAVWTVDNIDYLEFPNISDSSDATWITVSSDEDATFAGTALFAAGEGVVFNGDSNADANRLDDYEEGTWTPVLSDGTNNATSATAVGNYTKIGNTVFVNAYLATSSLGSVSGAIRITGLPFTSSSTSNQYHALVCTGGSNFSITAGYVVTGQVAPSTTYISLQLWDSTGGITNMQHTEWTANGNTAITGFYFV